MSAPAGLLIPISLYATARKRHSSPPLVTRLPLAAPARRPRYESPS